MLTIQGWPDFCSGSRLCEQSATPIVVTATEELAPIADAGGRGTPIAGGDTREGSQDPSEPAGPCQRRGN